MKKTKFMIGALVLSMGLLGTGYALWTDTLAVNATVNTGNLNMRFAKLNRVDNYMNNGDNKVDSKYTTFKSTAALAEGTSENDSNDEKDQIDINITGMVPGASTTVKAQMVNNGTVAAELNTIKFQGKEIDEDLSDALHVSLYMRNSDTKEMFQVYEGTAKDLIEVQRGEIALNSFGTDVVFVPGTADNKINFEMKIVMDEDAQNETQGKDVGFTVDFLFKQALEPAITTLPSN